MAHYSVVRMRNVNTIGLARSEGGRLARIADVILDVPSDNFEQVDGMHLMLGYLICTALGQRMVDGNEQIRPIGILEEIVWS